MPLRTRWRASWTARSASPTTAKAGAVPLSTWASTSMRRASMAVIPKLVAVAIMRPRYGAGARGWVTERAGSVAGRQRRLRRRSERGRQVPHGVAADRDHVKAHLPDAVVARQQPLGGLVQPPLLPRPHRLQRAAVPFHPARLHLTDDEQIALARQ